MCSASSVLAHPPEGHGAEDGDGGVLRLASIEDRVVPTASGSNVLDFSWTPAIRVVFKHRGSGFQDRVNNSPGLFHVIFAGEQSGISSHRIAEHTLIGIHLPSVRAASPG